jgi:hypothetical protein
MIGEDEFVEAIEQHGDMLMVGDSDGLNAVLAKIGVEPAEAAAALAALTDVRGVDEEYRQHYTGGLFDGLVLGVRLSMSERRHAEERALDGMRKDIRP